MFHNDQAAFDFTAIFNSLPGYFLLLQANAPGFTIVTATDSYLHQSTTTNDAIAGKSFFEVFPADGTLIKNLRESFEYVVTRKAPHSFKNETSTDLGALTNGKEKNSTTILNKPVLNSQGDVQYIIHTVQEDLAVTTNEAIQANAVANIKIEQGEKRLHSLINAAPLGIVLFTGRELIVEMPNQAFLDIVGKDSSIVGLPLIEAMPELVGQPFLDILDNVYTSGKIFETFETEVAIVKNGKITKGYYDFSYTPLIDANGSVYAILDISVDATERVLALKALEKSEQNLRNMILQAPVAMCILRGSGHVVEIANDRMFELWGAKAEKLLNQPIFEALPEVKGQGFEALLHKVMSTGETIFAHEVSLRVPRREHIQEIFVNFVYEPFREGDGTITGVMAVATDVSEQVFGRKKIEESEQQLQVRVKERTAELEQQKLRIAQSEERLRSVFNSAQSGMFTFTPVRDDTGEIVDFRFVITNANFASYVGQTPQVLNGALGSTWFPGYLQNGVFDMYKKTYLTGETLRIDIHYNVDLLDIYLDLKSTKIGGEVLVTFTDYTPLKKAQVQLEKYLEDLKRSNDSLEQFAYAASHDMKEPIRKIQVFTSRLKKRLESKLEQEDVGYFNRLETAAVRMGALIEDLLEFSHLTSERGGSEDVDLNKNISQVMEDLELELMERDATVIFDPLPVIKGHRRQILQLFQNLISNALKFSKPGIKPEIRISSILVKGSDSGFNLSDQDGSKNYFLVKVSDNGIGFEETYAERIFNMFQRLHSKEEYSGTGLGLSIVRKVVYNHNGFIVAEGNPGEGAVFKILFPAD